MLVQFQFNLVNLLKALTTKIKYLIVVSALSSISLFAEATTWVTSVDYSRKAKALLLEGHFEEAATLYKQAIELLEKDKRPEVASLVKQQRVAWSKDLSICRLFSQKASTATTVEERLKQQKLQILRLLKQNIHLKEQLVNNQTETLKIKALQDQVTDLKSQCDSLINTKEEQYYKSIRKKQDQVYVTACLRAQRLYSKSYQELKRVNKGLTDKNMSLQRSIENFKKQQRKLIGSSFYETIQAKISDLELTNALLNEKIKALKGNEISPNKTIDILQEANYKLREDRDQFYRKLEKYTGDAFESQVAINKELRKKNKQLERDLQHYKTLSIGQEQLLNRLFLETSTHDQTLNRLEKANTLISQQTDKILFLKEELLRQKTINNLQKAEKSDSK